MSTTFQPGDLVRARGREWVALPSSDPAWLCIRPLAGGEADIQVLFPALEDEPVEHARFDLPDIAQTATQDAGLLIAEALRLSLRRGAGPFRSAARVAFEPRAYQLVPLLMALRQSIVRLMIADDVGIGKTIEAGLILREMIDRGEIDRFAVLCPPHLVEQWTGELRSKFDLDTVAVTSSSAAGLERGLSQSQSLFHAHPHTVVSLDYIKAERRRDSFARACPGFVIVDEAHACVGTHGGRQQRFELLRRIAEDADRHMILLTATPHSGDEEAFSRLLSLLNSEFSSDTLENDAGRRRLARYFVQRRRADIKAKEWGETRSFPDSDAREKTYHFDAEHRAFHDAVLDYCLGVVERAGNENRRRRLAFWSTLALMRCVGSSPAAAHSALRTRLGDEPGLEEQLCDEDEAEGLDMEPASVMEEDKALQDLVRKAEKLTQKTDPKLEAVISLLAPLVKEGANPIVFCRFIATADHVGAGLRKAFPKLNVEIVTGMLTPEDRRQRIESIPTTQQRILVATDCLSEGINLQHLFDTVVHYDLSWNPTRHQQREGRVNRFGQPAKVVRSVLLYSPDSSIDGAVLDVVLRKAEAIRKATGVTVPLPEERTAVAGALMNAVLLRKGRTEQLRLDLGLPAESEVLERRWHHAEDSERRSRTRFAQNTLRPEEVVPEWEQWQHLLGGPAEVRRFLERALNRLKAPLDDRRDGTALVHVHALPPAVREQLAGRGMEDTVRVAFEEPAPAGAEVVVRSHPLPSTLADFLLEGALERTAPEGEALGRAGVWATASVNSITTVLLLRLRFKLTVHGRAEKLLLVEEASAVAFTGPKGDLTHEGEPVFELLRAEASENLAPVAQQRFLQEARQRVETALIPDGPLARYAHRRAQALLADHERVRSATESLGSTPRVTVEPVLPPDVLGMFVLLPGGF